MTNQSSGVAAVILGWHHSQYGILTAPRGQSVKIVHSAIGFSDAFSSALPQITSPLLQDFLDFLIQFREDLDASLVEKIVCIAPQAVQSLVNIQWFVDSVFDAVYIPIEFASPDDEIGTLLRNGGFDAHSAEKEFLVFQFAGKELVCWWVHGGQIMTPWRLNFSLVDLAHRLHGVEAEKEQAFLMDQLKSMQGYLKETIPTQPTIYFVGEDIERLMDLWGAAKVSAPSQKPSSTLASSPDGAISEESELNLMHRSLTHIIQWLGREQGGVIVPASHSYIYSKLLEIID